MLKQYVKDGVLDKTDKRNEINSNEARTRYYNQLEMAIDSDWKFEITRKDDAMRMRVMEYLKRLLAVQ